MFSVISKIRGILGVAEAFGAFLGVVFLAPLIATRLSKNTTFVFFYSVLVLKAGGVL